jgi:hypothetical protein
MLLVSTYVYGYYNGKEVVSIEYREYRVAQESEMSRIRSENAQRLSEQVKKTDEISRSYDAKIKSISSSYNSRISRLQYDFRTCGSRALSSDASTTGLTDATASNFRSSTTEFEAVVSKLESDCAATTLQTLHLQKWITDVCQLPTTSH